MEKLEEEFAGWLEREVAGCQFQDVRHGKRFVTLLGQLSEQIGGSIPFACQDWAATKADYQFLSSERISEGKILAGHIFCTRERTARKGASRKATDCTCCENARRWLENVKQSGFKAEEVRLRTDERISNLIALFCNTQLASLLDDDGESLHAGGFPSLSPDCNGTLSARPAGSRPTGPGPYSRTVAFHLTRLGRLAGNLARAKDPPPGNWSSGELLRA